MTESSKLFIEEKKYTWEDAGEGVRRKILGFDKNLMMVKVHFMKGSIGYNHKHFHTQVTYIESGSFEVQIAGERKVLTKGDSFYVPSSKEHGVICLDEGVMIDVFNPYREEFLKE